MMCAAETEEDLQFDEPFPEDIDSEDEAVLEAVKQLNLNKEKEKAAVEAEEEDDDAKAVETGAAYRRGEKLPTAKQVAKASSKTMDDGAGDGEDEESDDGAAGSAGSSSSKRQPQTKVWRPSDGLGADEKLEYDAKFYSCYHAMKADWPCLSFDIIRDKYGELRTKFPQTMYFVTGTQAEAGRDNKIIIMRVADIHRTKHEDDSDGEDEDVDPTDDKDDKDAGDDDIEADPILTTQTIDVDGEVNRIRSMPQQTNFIASWQSTGHVHIWNAHKQLEALQVDGPNAQKKIPTKPVYSFQHSTFSGLAVS